MLCELEFQHSIPYALHLSPIALRASRNGIKMLRVRGANQPDQYTKQYVVTLTLMLTKLSADDSRVSFITLRL